MDKVLLDYEPFSGQISLPNNGAVICTWAGLSVHNDSASPAVTLQLIKEGLSADEVIKLKNNGLI